ncbi:MAG: hypothetical protein ACRDN0_23275 [Trebonia sp.]
MSHAMYIPEQLTPLSKAQQTADRYVADAQDYGREIAQDAAMRGEEILREAKVRASVILDEAHASARLAMERAEAAGEGERPGGNRELETEIAYLRTFSDVCRTHLRAYLESLTRAIEEWERTEHEGARAARNSGASLAEDALPERHCRLRRATRLIPRGGTPLGVLPNEGSACSIGVKPPFGRTVLGRGGTAPGVASGHAVGDDVVRERGDGADDLADEVAGHAGRDQ